VEQKSRLIQTPDWFRMSDQRFPDLPSVIRREFTAGVEAERYADRLGVIAIYRNHLLVANFVNETLAQLKERNLEMPLSVLVDARFFASLGPEATSAVAMAESGILIVNPEADFWRDPLESSRLLYAIRAWSTPHPMHPIYHEIGHLRQIPQQKRQRPLTPRELTMAMAISRRAKENTDEFVAEVFAGLICDVKYDDDILRAYKR
jgi:hypothetical protein